MQIKRYAALAVVFCLIISCAMAEILWPPAVNAGQEDLQAYIDRVNNNLLLLRQPPVNSLFQLYPYSASLGITDSDDAEIPEGTELTFTMYADSLNMMVLRCSDAGRFADVAAACIQAAGSDEITLSECRSAPDKHVKKVRSQPDRSITETVIDLNGTVPRAYFSYYYNQYHDGVNWLEMTLVFPLAGSDGGGVWIDSSSGTSRQEQEYEGYNPIDNKTHIEVFPMATPEPDSPAGENYIP